MLNLCLEKKIENMTENTNLGRSRTSCRFFIFAGCLCVPFDILRLHVYDLIYSLDETEIDEPDEIASDLEAKESIEGEENEVSNDIQCLFTKANKVKFTKPNKFLFVPVSLSWKENKLREINVLKFHGEHKTASTYGKWCSSKEEPSSVHRIVDDGNCLFRAVSYVVSGSQEHYGILRKLAVAKMYDMGCEFKRITGQNAADYVKQTRMNELGVWGTDVEIFILSGMLNTPIFVFLVNENMISWIPHYPSLDASKLIESECIYLQNKNCHFEVVLEM